MPRSHRIPDRARDSNRAGNTATSRGGAIHDGTAVNASNRDSNEARHRQPGIPGQNEASASEESSATLRRGKARISVGIGKASLAIAGMSHRSSTAERSAISRRRFTLPRIRRRARARRGSCCRCSAPSPASQPDPPGAESRPPFSSASPRFQSRAHNARIEGAAHGTLA